MNDDVERRCTAFEGGRLVASGPLPDVAARVKAVVDAGTSAPVLVFDDATGGVVDLDLRGTVDDVVGRLTPATPTPVEAPVPRGPGRPRLGVVAREVTLLPRHWEWLATQPGGASVALRRLVEEARRTHEAPDRRRRASEAAYRFMSAMAGNEPGFEEAARALFAGDAAGFDARTAAWPADVASHARQLAGPAFMEPTGEDGS